MAKKYEVRNEGMRMPSTKLFDLVPRVLSLSPSREEERGPWEQESSFSSQCPLSSSLAISTTKANII